MIECVTENRNRTVAELRHALSKAGGSLGEAGSTGWQFRRVAAFTVAGKESDYDRMFELALEGGADDVTYEDGEFEIVGPVEAFKSIGDALRKTNLLPEDAGLRMIPNQYIYVDVGVCIEFV
jgi:transcriptional/translational regulatory protein YebC/TACO1